MDAANEDGANQLHLIRLTRVQIVLATLLTAALLAVSVQAAMALLTPLSCDNGGVNNCPAGSKYARSQIDYTRTGSGTSTNWTIQQRIFAGGLGLNMGDPTNTAQEWRIHAYRDYSANVIGSWTLRGSGGPGSWRNTDLYTWSPSFTIGSPLNINSQAHIRLEMDFRHRFCNWTGGPPGPWVCNGIVTSSYATINQASN